MAWVALAVVLALGLIVALHRLRRPSSTVKEVPAAIGIKPAELPDRSPVLAVILRLLREQWLLEAHRVIIGASQTYSENDIREHATKPHSSVEPVVVAFQALAVEEMLMRTLQYTRPQALARTDLFFAQMSDLSPDALHPKLGQFRKIRALGDPRALPYSLTSELCAAWTDRSEASRTHPHMVSLILGLDHTTQREAFRIMVGLEPSQQFNLRASSLPISGGPDDSVAINWDFVDECLAYLTVRGLPTDDEVAGRICRTFVQMEVGGLADKFVLRAVFDILLRTTCASALSVSGIIALNSGLHDRALSLLTAANSVLSWPTTLFALAKSAALGGNHEVAAEMYHECIVNHERRAYLIDPTGFLGHCVEPLVAAEDADALFLGYATVDALVADARKFVRAHD